MNSSRRAEQDDVNFDTHSFFEKTRKMGCQKKYRNWEPEILWWILRCKKIKKCKNTILKMLNTKEIEAIEN